MEIHSHVLLEQKIRVLHQVVTLEHALTFPKIRL